MVSRGFVLAVVIASSVLFMVCAFLIHPLAGKLSPIALAIVLGYSATKRWTAYSHLVLGLALALAPMGGWVAVSGNISPPAMLLLLGVLFWVSGFDILYSLQDAEFDCEAGLNSIPARFGVRRSYIISRGLHIAAFLCFVCFGFQVALSNGWFIACAITGLLLATEHYLALEPDKIPMAFFNINALIGFVMLGGLIYDLATILYAQ
ncbi:MAG: UbiA family prenyltransferase [Candidatus Lindowbacteria bacterium]|nr:UbiA family prenyltransferase [Candidatus Lindowbacteria bacterium]